MFENYLSRGIDQAVGPPRLRGLKHHCGRVVRSRRDAFNFFQAVADVTLPGNEVVFVYLAVGCPEESALAIDWEQIVRAFRPVSGEAVYFFPVEEGRGILIEIVFIGYQAVIVGCIQQAFHTVPHDIVGCRDLVAIDSLAGSEYRVGAEYAYLLVGRRRRDNVSVGEQLGRVRVFASVSIEHDLLVGNSD